MARLITILAAIASVIAVLTISVLLKTALLPFRFARSLFRRRPAAT